MKKLWNFHFIYLILLNTLSSIGFYMTMPTLPSFAVEIGATLSMAGVLSGLFSLTALFIRPVAGMATDRWNKKRLLIIATLLISASTLGYSRSTSFAMLVALRILHGTAFAFSSTSNMALTTLYIPKDRMGEGVGYMGIAQILAMACGPGLGLRLANSIGHRQMFLVSTAIIFSAALLMLLVRYDRAQLEPESAPQRKFSIQSFIAPELLLCALMSSLFSMSNGIISSFMPLMAAERGITGADLFFTISSVVVLLVRPFAGKLLDRKGMVFVLIPAYAVGAISAVMIGTARALWILLAAAVLKSVAQSSGQPAVQAACVSRVSVLRRGVALSTCYLGNDIGQGLGTMLGGSLSESFGYTNMFCITGGIMLMGIVFLMIDRTLWRRRQSKTAAPA